MARAAWSRSSTAGQAGQRRRWSQPRAAKPVAGRAFADPFAAEDTGANCIRCGYLVEPEREKRGLLTCHQCR